MLCVAAGAIIALSAGCDKPATRAAAPTSIPEVERVEKCVVRKTGNEYLVDMHVEVDPQMTVQRAHDVAHAAKDKVRSALPSVQDVLAHIEPHR